MSGEIDTRDNIVIKKIIKLIERCPWSNLQEEDKIARVIKMMQEKKTRKRDPSDTEVYWGFLETCIDYMVFDLEATRRRNEYLEKQNDDLKEQLEELNE